MSAKAALSRGSLTDAMPMDGSASSGVLAAEVALRPKMVFTRERSWLRLLDVLRSVLMALPPRTGLCPTCASS